MRVLLVGTGVQPIPPTGYGGVERTIADLAASIQAAGETARIVQEVRRGRSIDEYWFARHLPRLLAAESFDVVHATTPVVANQLARLGYSYVYTSHSRHWFERRGLRQRWGAFLERRAVRHAAQTIALTARVARRIQEETGIGGPDRVTEIPIGVDSEQFAPDWGRRSGVEALGVGIVAPAKRWELAARALKGSGFRLRIAGPVPDAVYGRSIVASGDRVDLLGEVDQSTLGRLFAESDVYIHPSRVELLPGAVLQALAAALPVLGTEVVADVVDPGTDGWIAPSGADADGVVRFLAEKAALLGSDAPLRRRMGEAGRRRAQTAFSWSTVAQAHLALYRRVVAGVAPTRR